MMEIKLCGTCAKYRCTEHAGNQDRTVEVNPASMVSCADCEVYALHWQMTTKADGRVICPACQSRIEKLTAKKAQLGFFDQQSLFG